MPRNHAHHTAFTNGFYVDEGRDFAGSAPAGVLRIGRRRCR